MIDINNFMKKKHIPRELQQRVRKYLEYVFDAGINF